MAKRSINKIPSKSIVSFALIIIIIASAVGIFKFFIRRYSYFKVFRVVVSGVNDAYAEIGRRLIGRNIFSINLSAVKNEIQEAAVDLECISIQRRFPNEILLKLRKRIAIAQLKLLRFYPIDQEGMIVGRASDWASEDLPVILGLDNRILQPKIVKIYPSYQLRSAIELIQAKNNAVNLNNYKLTRIDFSNAEEPSFFIIEDYKNATLFKNANSKTRPQVEIKFNRQAPVKTIKMLGLILAKQAGSLENIEYINLKNPNSPVFLEKKQRP